MAKSDLTPKQKATIDRVLDTYPGTSAEDAIGEYYPSYARSYKIYLAVKYKTFTRHILITHCDHEQSARNKVVLIRSYIARRKAAQS